MVSLKEHKLKQELRKLVGRFVTTDSKHYYPQLYNTLKEIHKHKYPAFLC